MTHVNLTYNPYQVVLTIQINNVPISPRSSLKKFEKMPFFEWSEQIFPVLSHEINDHFDIEYTGQLIECEVLKYHADKCIDCNAIIYKAPTLDMSPVHRLKILNQLFGNGVLPYIPRTKHSQQIFSSESNVLLKYPTFSFCRLLPVVHTLDELNDSCLEKNENIIVFLSNYDETYIQRFSNCKSNIMWFILGEWFKCLLVNETQLVFSIPQNKINDSVQQCLNLQFYPALLTNILNILEINTPQREVTELQYIDRIEPGIKVSIPRIVEVGKTKKIIISSIPTGYQHPDVEYQISDNSLIEIKNNELFAKKEGGVYLTVINANTGQTITTNRINCIQKVYLEKITLEPDNLILKEGDKYKIRLYYYPTNADNISDIKYTSTNPLVAYADKDIVYAKHSGVCTITLSCDNISVDCNVEVCPQMTSFSITPSEMKLILGNVEHFKLEQYPKSSILEQYSVKTYPEGIVNVDIDSRMIHALTVGGTIVDIVSADGQIKKSIRVTVIDKKANDSVPELKSGSPSEIKTSIIDKIFRRK